MVSGLSSLSVPDRATIANMAPEYGATMGFFPVDNETLAYLHFTARTQEHVALVEAYCKEQMLFRSDATPAPLFNDTLELDFGKRGAHRRGTETSAGPRAAAAGEGFVYQSRGRNAGQTRQRSKNNGDSFDLSNGSVVIAAITSCTNTSNPSLMLGAGLLAKKAVERGLNVKAWVKTSLAPGSKVVTGLSAGCGADAISREAEISSGGIWLHDLHRQQRAAFGRRSARPSRTTG